MRKLSEGRIEALALAVAKALKAEGGLRVADEGATVRATAARLQASMGSDPGRDVAVRARIASLSRQVPEGSREWDVLYRQYWEELARRG